MPSGQPIDRDSRSCPCTEGRPGSSFVSKDTFRIVLVRGSAAAANTGRFETGYLWVDRIERFEKTARHMWPVGFASGTMK